MRWLFLLLVVLNIFYYVWHQQEAPLRAKEVVSLSLYKGSQQGIRLLREARPALIAGDARAGPAESVECLYIGGLPNEDQLRSLQRKLSDNAMQSVPVEVDRSELVGYVLKVTPQSSTAAGEIVLQDLSIEFNGLKYKKMSCEGLQLPDSLHRMAPAPQ